MTKPLHGKPKRSNRPVSPLTPSEREFAVRHFEGHPGDSVRKLTRIIRTDFIPGLTAYRKQLLVDRLRRAPASEVIKALGKLHPNDARLAASFLRKSGVKVPASFKPGSTKGKKVLSPLTRQELKFDAQHVTRFNTRAARHLLRILKTLGGLDDFTAARYSALHENLGTINVEQMERIARNLHPEDKRAFFTAWRNARKEYTKHDPVAQPELEEGSVRVDLDYERHHRGVLRERRKGKQ